MSGCLAQLLADRFAERARSTIAVAIEPRLVMIGRPVGSGSHGRHQNRAPENPQEMVVNFVVESPLTLFIGARHRADVQRGTVRINDPLPGDKHPRLAVLDGVAVLAYQPRTLRN